MLIEINFPDNLITTMLLENLEEKKIPCVFCAAGQDMEIKFRNIFPDEVIGKVKGLDWRLLEERAPGGTGGEYTHYNSTLIILSKQNDNIYHIKYLSLFYYFCGWCDVIENGEYAIPRNFSSDEEDDIGR